MSAAILDLHSVCRSTIQHKGHSALTHMHRGVRQGRALAPLLWLVCSAYMTLQLTLQLPEDWVHRHLTLYVDDRHASCTMFYHRQHLGSQSCFEGHSDNLRQFYHRQHLGSQICFQGHSDNPKVYKQHSMKVIPSKSGVVLRVRGRAAKEFLQLRVV